MQYDRTQARHFFPRSRDTVDLDITWDCNIKCAKCNKCCAVAPSNDGLSLEQIETFLQESVTRDIKWKRISIVGGEPTIHPEIMQIIRSIVDYKERNSNDTLVQLYTNGTGEATLATLGHIANTYRTEQSLRSNTENAITDKHVQIAIFNSMKGSLPEVKDSFIQVYRAGTDIGNFDACDYEKGCWVSSFGIELCDNGYYVCGVAGAIDRVFGFDIGRKQVPDIVDEMLDQRRVLCSLCGYFLSPSANETINYNLPINEQKPEFLKRIEEHRPEPTKKVEYSPSWCSALAAYRKQTPLMTKYR